MVGPMENKKGWVRVGERIARRITHRSNRLRVVVLTVLAIFYATLLLPPPPFVEAIVYAGFAPVGWHNASVSGPKHFGLNYAVSSTVPGLILAHGTTDEPHWGVSATSTYRNQYWRTRDGGVHWEALAIGPCGNMRLCSLAAPVGGDNVFFTRVYPSSQFTGPQVWVTHDAGTSWRRVTTNTIDIRRSNYFQQLVHATVRNGRLYMMYAPDDNYSDPGHTVFSVSSDDGASWTATATAQSTLEREGWGVVSVAADYQAPGAWYRALVRAPNDATATPMLEHSLDDGRTWTTIGPFGNTSTRLDLSLATNSATPERLCAYTGQIAVLASTNGGRAFQAATVGGVAPVTFKGYAPVPVQMGEHGECFLTLIELHIGATLDESWDASLIWTAAPGATALTPLPGLGEYRFETTNETPVAYMPGGPGFPARILTATWGAPHPWKGWASLLGGTYGLNEEELLLWMPVP